MSEDFTCKYCEDDRVLECTTGVCWGCAKEIIEEKLSEDDTLVKLCECKHPKNEHLETVGECRHYFDPKLKEVNESGENAHGVYCNCKKFRFQDEEEGKND